MLNTKTTKAAKVTKELQENSIKMSRRHGRHHCGCSCDRDEKIPTDKNFFRNVCFIAGIIVVMAILIF